MESLGLKPRGYQLEVLEKAKRENTIVFMETGCGKTLIAVMLILDVAERIRNSAASIAVFLAPSVPLVQQQAQVIKSFTDLNVGCFCGGELSDRWSHEHWKEEVEKNVVFVMTPQVLLTNLRHCFLKMDMIELLIFDECHHAQKKHPYASIMNEFYLSQSGSCPRVFGMTASPVIGKGGIRTSECALMFSELESQLHSKVYTVKDREELDLINPSPTLRCIYYDSTYLTYVLCVHSTLEELKLKHLRPLTNFEERLSTEGGEPLKLVLKRRKELTRVFATLKYCLEELGLWCTQKAAKLLGSDESDLETETKLGCKSRKGFLQDVYSMVKAVRSREKLPETVADDFSSKVKALLDVLQEHHDEGLKCIIFVERVMAAIVIAELLSNLSNFHFVQCKPLTGSHSSVASMSRNQQQSLVEQFRSGEINVLVATNIAEEGLDVQSCGLIIRFDLPPTVRSFIQSRGRARLQGSTYVLLCERGSTEKDAHLKTLLLAESMMYEQASLRGSEPRVALLPESRDLEAYCVQKTGATVNTDSSVSLLHDYCAKLPGDKFYSPAPDFSFTETQTLGFSCTITLPPNAPFRTIVGHECDSNTRARQVACLEACKQLHACGALTDFLLPACDSEDDGEDKPFGIRNKTATGLNPEELYPSAMPCGFAGFLVAEKCFHTYRICVAPNPASESVEYADFALYLESSLDSELEAMELTLDLPQQRSVTIKLVPCGVVHLTHREIEDGKLFQSYLFSTILDFDGLLRDHVCLGGRSLPLMDAWDASKSYLLLPLSASESPSDPGQAEIDWMTIKKVLSTSGLDSRGFPESDAPVYKVSVRGNGLDAQTLQVADGLASVEDIVGAVVVVTHKTDRKVYYILDVIQQWNSYSRFNDAEYDSYVTYFKLRHGETLLYPEQCLLRARRLSVARNLLVSRSTGAPSPTVMNSIKSTVVELPPELCKIRMLGFSARLVNGVHLLPSVMHRLESMLIAEEFRDRMAVTISDSGKIPIMKILQCLTTAKCAESFNLERLELLGDSFLKFAVSQRLFLLYENKHEGQLSFRRARTICNSALHQLGVARGIPAFIRDELFAPRDWVVPGRWCRVVCDPCVSAMLHAKGDDESSVGSLSVAECTPRLKRKVRCSEGHRWMHQKTVADVVEALIGMHLVECGPDSCLAFMGWMGIAVDFDPSLKFQAQNCMEVKGVPRLERALAYTFRNKALMVQAITHASHSDPVIGCYQRLEFLGDAVLDFLITKYLYTKFPELQPGLLTDLRSASVSNDHFARIAVRHNLHNFLRHNSGSLSKQLKEFVLLLQDNLLETWEGDKAPKVLGDLVESLAGAVLVDSNFDIDKVWAVFEPLLQPIATPETVAIHPVRELLELCQSNSWGTPEYKTQLGDNSVSVSATVTIKDATITGNGEKVDGGSAKRVAAQDALNQLESKGFRHLRHELVEVLSSIKGGDTRGGGEESRSVTAASMSEEMIDLANRNRPVPSVMETRPESLDNSYSQEMHSMEVESSFNHSGVEGEGGGYIHTCSHKPSENGQSASDSAGHDSPPPKQQSAYRAKLPECLDPIYATAGTVRPSLVECEVRSQVQNGAVDSSSRGLRHDTAAVDELIHLKNLMLREQQLPMSLKLGRGGDKLQTDMRPTVAPTVVGAASEAGSKYRSSKPAVSQFETTTDFLSGIPASDYAHFLRLRSEQDGSRSQADEIHSQVAGCMNRIGVESECFEDVQMHNRRTSKGGETAGTASREHDAPSLEMPSAQSVQVGEVPDPTRHGLTEIGRPSPVDCKTRPHVGMGLSNSSSSGHGQSTAAEDLILKYLEDLRMKREQELDQIGRKSGHSKTATSESRTPLVSVRGIPAEDYAPFLRQMSELERSRPQASKTQSAPDPVPNDEIHAGYYRSRLHEICARKKWPSPDFRPLNRVDGCLPAEFHFEVGVAVPPMQKFFYEGSKLSSKKAAMESAAKTAVEYLASLNIS